MILSQFYIFGLRYSNLRHKITKFSSSLGILCGLSIKNAQNFVEHNTPRQDSEGRYYELNTCIGMQENHSGEICSINCKPQGARHRWSF